jgi:hypothetical protein
MTPPKSLSKEFNDMVGRPFDEAAFRTQATREGHISRVIREGARVTKDFRTNRVNAKLDASNKVEKIYFG